MRDVRVYDGVFIVRCEARPELRLVAGTRLSGNDFGRKALQRPAFFGIFTVLSAIKEAK